MKTRELIFSNKRNGALTSPVGILLSVLSLIGVVLIVCSPSWKATLPLAVGLPALSLFLIKNAKTPDLGLKAVIVAAFLINGFTRFVHLPLGLGIDFLLLIVWLTIFFKSYRGVDWSPLQNLFVYCLSIWTLYCILQLFNPQAKSTLAWFYASRGIALYAFFLLPAIFLLFNTRAHVRWFIDCWFIFSIVFGVYGAKQYWFGLFGFEQVWLNEHGYLTHILWGEFTRMFSFLSDANQFGISQAHCGIVATVLAISTKPRKRRTFYTVTALVCYYGMIISGTRGAMVIPGVGGIILLVLSRNRWVILSGGVAGSVIYYFLAHTYVLNHIGAVSRMRSVFNSYEDESFLVRLNNRKLLDAYMADKPFGGGIGSAGNWGNRFSPNTFLAEFETDGMYVRLHAETGIVGFYLYCIIYTVILGKMILICWRLKNRQLRFLAIGLTCGVFGIMASNYGADNSVGLPTSILVLFSIAIVWMTQKWDQGEQYPKFQASNSREKDRSNLSK